MASKAPRQTKLGLAIADHVSEGKTLQYAANASIQREGISCGISMFYGTTENWPYLLRYEIEVKY